MRECGKRRSMSKVATNRANLKYAQDLKRRGFATVVHALPPEAQQYVDELLSKGWKGVRISNEINSRYGEILPKIGLKPLSKLSINTYRKKYWKKTPALAMLVNNGDDKTKKEIKKVHKDLDLYGDMIKGKKLMDKFTKKSVKFTKKLPIPAETTVRMVERQFLMNRDLLHEQFALGIATKQPIAVVHSGTVNVNLSIKERFSEMKIAELLKLLQRSIKALSGHKDYGISKFTGEDLSGLS